MKQNKLATIENILDEAHAAVQNIDIDPIDDPVAWNLYLVIKGLVADEHQMSIQAIDNLNKLAQ